MDIAFVGDHGPLGGAGGSRGINDKCHILRIGLQDHLVKGLRVPLFRLSPQILHILVADDQRVVIMAESLHIHDHHLHQQRELVFDLQDLVRIYWT